MGNMKEMLPRLSDIGWKKVGGQFGFGKIYRTLVFEKSLITLTGKVFGLKTRVNLESLVLKL